MPQTKQVLDALSLVFVGHVDHGKSSVIGRLLMDTDSIRPDVVEGVREVCRERGKRFEYAYLLDAFQEEREQGITIDTTKIEFSTEKRQYTIIDAPGHKEFLKNMASGASRAQAALLVVDAEQGVQEQTRKHAHILSLIGVTQVCVLVNKMDLVDYDKAVFENVREDIVAYLSRLDITPEHVIPVSAIEGDNITAQSGEMAWYDGPTVEQVLDALDAEESLAEKPLRLPIQDVYKFDKRRIVAGRVEAGRIAEGDAVVIHPDGKETVVETVEDLTDEREAGVSGESIGVTLADEYFLERGSVIAHADQKPTASNLFECTVFWMGREDLVFDKEYTLKLGTQAVPCRVHSINRVVSAETLGSSEDSSSLSRYEVGELVLQAKQPVVFDPFSEVSTTGRFVLVDGYDVAGGGIIERVPEVLRERSEIAARSMHISPKESLVSLAEREARNQHKGLVVWLTGLAGCGKERIAQALERELFDEGVSAYYLDSSNVRLSLSSDLSFSEKQRHEHARRVSELANYLYNAGHVVIVSIISPYKDDRAYARDVVGEEHFMEVFVDAPLAVCESQDPHGIYTRARSGEISGVPGVDIEYEQSDGVVQLLSVQEAGFDAEHKARELARIIQHHVER